MYAVKWHSMFCSFVCVICFTRIEWLFALSNWKFRSQLKNEQKKSETENSFSLAQTGMPLFRRTCALAAVQTLYA